MEVGSQTIRSPHTHTMARIIFMETTGECVRIVEVYPIKNRIRTVAALQLRSAVTRANVLLAPDIAK
jgi:hypothetical protein